MAQIAMWCTVVIPTPRKQRQENQAFKVILDYIMHSWIAWAMRLWHKWEMGRKEEKGKKKH